MNHRAQLEQLLADVLRKEQPKISEVHVSSDGEFAIYDFKDRYLVRKLSPAAKDFYALAGLSNRPRALLL